MKAALLHLLQGELSEARGNRDHNFVSERVGVSSISENVALKYLAVSLATDFLWQPTFMSPPCLICYK